MAAACFSTAALFCASSAAAFFCASVSLEAEVVGADFAPDDCADDACAPKRGAAMTSNTTAVANNFRLIRRLHEGIRPRGKGKGRSTAPRLEAGVNCLKRHTKS